MRLGRRIQTVAKQYLVLKPKQSIIARKFVKAGKRCIKTNSPEVGVETSYKYFIKMPANFIDNNLLNDA